MFYKTNVDISNPKSMFNFLNEHYTYDTMNSWNNMESIANNVKLHRLHLDGDYCVALAFLESEGYESINDRIRMWEHDHPGYELGFNGRSGGYLVLYNKGSNKNVLPDDITGYDSYEDWKADIKDWGYRVSDYKNELIEYTQLVRDFDKFCDELRDYVNILSTLNFQQLKMVENIERFEWDYEEDLELLGCDELEVDDKGRVDVTAIKKLKCLYESLLGTLNMRDYGYDIKETQEDGRDYIEYVERRY